MASLHRPALQRFLKVVRRSSGGARCAGPNDGGAVSARNAVRTPPGRAGHRNQRWSPPLSSVILRSANQNVVPGHARKMQASTFLTRYLLAAASTSFFANFLTRRPKRPVGVILTTSSVETPSAWQIDQHGESIVCWRASEAHIEIACIHTPTLRCRALIRECARSGRTPCATRAAPASALRILSGLSGCAAILLRDLYRPQPPRGFALARRPMTHTLAPRSRRAYGSIRRELARTPAGSNSTIGASAAFKRCCAARPTLQETPPSARRFLR
jgi:hypothetical protein